MARSIHGNLARIAGQYSIALLSVTVFRCFSEAPAILATKTDIVSATTLYLATIRATSRAKSAVKRDPGATK
jgi:hypothetical protein